MRILIAGGHVIDPGRLDGLYDVLMEDGVILDVLTGPFPSSSADRVIDARGKIVTPGLIDLHVHFREPGHEHKETIATGCRAAAHGGFTAVCAMPNTHPPNDSGWITRAIHEAAENACGVRVYPVGAISRGLRGDVLSDFAALKEAGVVAVSDDGMPVTSSRLMRQALEHARALGLTVISHSEDLSLAEGGVMNEGETSARLKLPGIPNAAESIAVMRDIALCELTGARLHIAHVSTAESVRAIRDAKRRGVPVTAETAPHYFTLTDAVVEVCHTHAKMNPPLRSERDRQAVREGLADGSLDAIATDHAPHSPKEKDVPFHQAANGVIGLETSLPVSLTLVRDGVLTLPSLIQKMSVRPAEILGVDNRLKPGAPADITVIDPAASYKIDAGRFQSKSRNTPFDGWRVTGKAVLTLVGGKIVFDAATETPDDDEKDG